MSPSTRSPSAVIRQRAARVAADDTAAAHDLAELGAARNQRRARGRDVSGEEHELRRARSDPRRAAIRQNKIQSLFAKKPNNCFQ